MVQPGQQADVCRREVRAAAIYRIINLPAQVFVVLSGQPRYRSRRIPLSGNPMAPAAEMRVARSALPEKPPVSVTDRRVSIDVADIGRHIGNGLSVRQIVATGNALHQQIPASIVAIIQNLLAQNRAVLTGNARHVSVKRSAALGSVAHGAGAKDFRSLIEVRDGVADRRQFLPRRRKCWHARGQ